MVNFLGHFETDSNRAINYIIGDIIMTKIEKLKLAKKLYALEVELRDLREHLQEDELSGIELGEVRSLLPEQELAEEIEEIEILLH